MTTKAKVITVSRVETDFDSEEPALIFAARMLRSGNVDHVTIVTGNNTAVQQVMRLQSDHFVSIHKDSLRMKP